MTVENIKAFKIFEKYLIWYYIILFLIQISWVDLHNFPPTGLRLIMFVSVFLPLIIFTDYIPFVFTLAIILRGNFLTNYQYLPDIHSAQIYWGLLVILVIIRKSKFRSNVDFLYLLILTIIWFLTDMLFTDMLLSEMLFKGAAGGNLKSLIFMLLIFPFLDSKKSLQYMALAFVIASLLLSIYYLIYRDMFMVNFNSDKNLQRASWIDPNYFSTTLCIGYSITLMFLLNYLKRPELFITRDIFLISFIVVEIITIFLLASRAGIICMAIMTSFLTLFSKIKKSWKVAMILFFAGVVIISYRANFLSVILYRFQNEGNVADGGGRLEIWNLFLNNFLNQPFEVQILGNGFEDAVKLANGMNIHNDWLGILNNYGIIGVIMWLVLLIRLFIYRADNKMVIYAILLLYLLASLTLNPSFKVYYPLFILWGFGINSFSKQFNVSKLQARNYTI